ncbi:MAG: fibrobacter succinogenes major paralogous domain-containing protein [Dysgonamonadaceae bacterium]|nr:fibrobacter succinogenes major paralogous domain-containing protein [Dysgonamonadaceae bacterium]
MLPQVFLTNVSDWQLSGNEVNGKGMMIYNTNENVDEGNGEGIYVWKGQWVFVQSLSGNLSCSGLPEIISTSTLNVSGPAYDWIAPELTVTIDDKGDSGLTYKWQQSADGSTGWATASGEAAFASYSVPNSTDGTFYYRNIVKNACGTKISPVFTVTITPCDDVPYITSPAGDETKIIKVGEALPALSVTVETDNTTPDYQWYSSTDKITWILITNATNSSYIVPVDAGSTTYYRCVASTDCSVSSPVFTVYVCDSYVEDAENNLYSTGDFGSAGIWMTMNLRTKGSLIANGTPGSDLSAKYYWYPGQDTNLPANQADDILDSHPEYGLLYTWAAATDRTGITTNEGQGQPAEAGSNNIQGICPTGWHIPSDREWNELEKEIANSVEGTYGTGTTTSWDSSWETAMEHWRPDSGVGHGTIMKSVMSVSNFATNGGNKSCTTGGFDALLVGRQYLDQIDEHGHVGYHWTSSSGFTGSAYTRNLWPEYSGMLRAWGGKVSQRSVRCKQDVN